MLSLGHVPVVVIDVQLALCQLLPQRVHLFAHLLGLVLVHTQEVNVLLLAWACLVSKVVLECLPVPDSESLFSCLTLVVSGLHQIHLFFLLGEQVLSLLSLSFELSNLHFQLLDLLRRLNQVGLLGGLRFLELGLGLAHQLFLPAEVVL